MLKVTHSSQIQNKDLNHTFFLKIRVYTDEGEIYNFLIILIYNIDALD